MWKVSNVLLFKQQKRPFFAFVFFIIDLFVQDMAIIDVLTISQSFPTNIEAKLCRNISEHLQSYIVLVNQMSNNCYNWLWNSVASGKCMYGQSSLKSTHFQHANANYELNCHYLFLTRFNQRFRNILELFYTNILGKLKTYLKTHKSSRFSAVFSLF